MEDLWLSRNTWGKGFHKRRLFTANVYDDGRKRLQGKTGTEIASPILDKRVLATVLARTCGKNPAGGVFVNLTSVAPPS